MTLSCSNLCEEALSCDAAWLPTLERIAKSELNPPLILSDMFFLDFFISATLRQGERQRDWMSVFNVPSPWNVRLKTESKALWKVGDKREDALISASNIKRDGST